MKKFLVIDLQQIHNNINSDSLYRNFKPKNDKEISSFDYFWNLSAQEFSIESFRFWALFSMN